MPQQILHGLNVVSCLQLIRGEMVTVMQNSVGDQNAEYWNKRGSHRRPAAQGQSRPVDGALAPLAQSSEQRERWLRFIKIAAVGAAKNAKADCFAS